MLLTCSIVLFDHSQNCKNHDPSFQLLHHKWCDQIKQNLCKTERYVRDCVVLSGMLNYKLCMAVNIWQNYFKISTIQSNEDYFLLPLGGKNIRLCQGYYLGETSEVNGNAVIITIL